MHLFKEEIRFLEKRLLGLQKGNASAAAKAAAVKQLHEARLSHYEQFEDFDSSKHEKDTVEDAEEQGAWVRAFSNRTCIPLCVCFLLRLSHA